MKKIFIASLVVALSVLAMAPAMAEENHGATSTPSAMHALAKIKYVRRAANLTGTIVSLAGTTAPTTLVINVTKLAPKKAKNWTGAYPIVGQSLTVQIASTTRIIREYYGKTGLSELQTGDSVSIVAKTNEDGTVTAQLVKDNSIHVFSRTGKISSIDTVNGTFVLTYGKNNTTTVTVKTDANTKFKVANVTNPTLSNLTVSSTVMVSGLVNSNTKTVYVAKTVRLIKK